MAVACEIEHPSRLDVPHHAPARSRRLRRKHAFLLVAINLLVFTGAFLTVEAAFRVFWNPRYWIHCNRWMIGSGQTEVGKKWWPNTTYVVEGSEFHLAFRTDDSGYRARLEPVVADHPYRIAFVGDSFTEAMQVPYQSTFCAQLECLLNQDAPARPRICVNYGVSATDLFDYWHRIIHDVLPRNPPNALVLCLFPGNDFQGLLPDDGFDSEDRPLRDYFRKPAWTKHVIAWINLHSKFGFFVQRALLSWNPGGSRPIQGPKNWWTDPEAAARAENTTVLRRSRSLFQAMVKECRDHGTKLSILVVGPVANYRSKDGQSPLAKILSKWQIDVPVIDVAIKARTRRDWASMVFRFDGHLNESGHTYVAQEAAPLLRAVLDGDGLTTARRDSFDPGARRTAPRLPEARVLRRGDPNVPRVWRFCTTWLRIDSIALLENTGLSTVGCGSPGTRSVAAHRRVCPRGLEGASFVLEIVNYPHPALRYPSRSVTQIDDELRATVRTMFDLMYAAKGIGLAANQVALPFRFFILNLTADPEHPDQEQVFINPEIVKRHAAVEDEEGCLSLPGVYGQVRRARRIRVRCYDLEGNLVEHEADELFSRAIQHETDHLDGKLFIDYLQPPVPKLLEERLREFEDAHRQAQESGALPSDDDLVRRLNRMTHPVSDMSDNANRTAG